MQEKKKDPVFDAVPDEVKNKLIDDDLRVWRNTLYQATVRMRVAARAGNKEIEAAALKDAETAQKMIDGYEAMRAELVEAPTK